MIGSEGADYFDGWIGSDNVVYSGSDEGVEVDLAQGTGYGGHAAGDTLINVENVIGSDYDDMFRGSEADNTFDGGAGDDTFWLDAGADVYNGGADHDTLIAAGDDMIIDLALGRGFGGYAEGDQYSGIEGVSLFGNNNAVVGTSDAETVGVYGRDNGGQLGGGADTVELGLSLSGYGSMSFDGGSGDDTIDLSTAPLPAGQGFVVNLSAESLFKVDTGSGLTVGAVSEFSNFENVIGSNAKDVLTDNKENNTFTGNFGPDVFRFLHEDQGERDVITDFAVGVDKIDLSQISNLGQFGGYGETIDVLGMEIPTDDAVNILGEIRDKGIGLPKGISLAYQDGDDVVIYTDFAADNAVTLQGVDMGPLSLSDFIL